MANIDFLGKAIDIVNKAIEEDKAGNAEEALSKYQHALEYFSTAMKYEKNEKSKETIRKKFTEYLDRAEELQKIVKSANGNVVTANGGSTAAKKKGQGGGEDEDAKMRGAITQSVLSEKPNVKWSDIAGLEQAKERLKEAVIMPIKFPHLFKGKRRPWQGILLYGPPGTGKSYLAKAVATEAISTFFSILPSDLISKWLGDSEKLVRELFQMAQEQKPSVIFIDEVDSLTGTRGEGESEASRRIKTEFLVRMNGIKDGMENVLVLGATNMPWALDPAIRRRFEIRIYIPLPDRHSRVRLFQLHIGDTPHTCTLCDLQQLADMTEGFSGADISLLVNDALYEPVRKIQLATHFKKVQAPCKDNPKQMRTYLTPCSPGDAGAIEMPWEEVKEDELMEPPLTMADFAKAVTSTKKTVDDEYLKKYEKFTEDFGVDG